MLLRFIFLYRGFLPQLRLCLFALLGPEPQGPKQTGHSTPSDIVAILYSLLHVVVFLFVLFLFNKFISNSFVKVTTEFCRSCLKYKLKVFHAITLSTS